MPESYRIHGEHHTEYLRARECIARAYREAQVLNLRASSEAFAEAVLARLAALEPPMLVVALDEVEESG